LAAGADAVICDLEDAVVPAEKERARELVTQLLRETPPSCARMVRVNAADSPFFAGDVRALDGLALEALVLPKATPAAVEALGGEGPPILALVETAQGVRLAYETASQPRVFALALGAADLGAEVGLSPRPDGLELLYARSKVVIDSAAAGLRPPFDIVHLDVRDQEGLEAECLLARSLGFRGKLCIHPAQVEVVNRVFAPTREEVEWAQRVLAVHAEGGAAGRGAVSLEGSMVDLPVVERARRLLAEAGKEEAR
jgi:citrate lyase beta subunit